MISLKNVLSLITIVAALFVVIRSDISDLNLPPNICLCVNIRNCNVRDSACGNVFDQAPYDGCYIYTGQKTECIISGNVAQFFETIYYSQSGWIVGINLILGTGPECGISDGCAEVSCQNGGSCYNTLNGSVCMCAAGYEGPLCQSDDSMLILRNDLAGSSSMFFHLPWTQYQQGFGSPTALYWIGLDSLHNVTQGNCQVRFDMQDIADGTWHYAQYSTFSVGDSSTNYVLTIGGWSGDTGYDAIAYNNGRPFTTYDADHDASPSNCASSYGGGFWYGWCANAFITTSTSSNNFFWSTSTGYMYLNAVEVSLLCQ